MSENKLEKIAELKNKIDFEHSEEYKNVELFRPLIKEVDKLSKSFISTLINKSQIKRLNDRMQEFADIANHHQRRKNEFRKELYELEKSRD
jgi:hypothetical protein